MCFEMTRREYGWGRHKGESLDFFSLNAKAAQKLICAQFVAHFIFRLVECNRGERHITLNQIRI